MWYQIYFVRDNLDETELWNMKLSVQKSNRDLLRLKNIWKHEKSNLLVSTLRLDLKSKFLQSLFKIFLTSSARTSIHKHTRDQKARETRPEKDPLCTVP